MKITESAAINDLYKMIKKLEEGNAEWRRLYESEKKINDFLVKELDKLTKGLCKECRNIE